MPQKIPSKVIFFLFDARSSRRKISSWTKEKNGPAARWLNSRQFLENVQPDLGQKSFSEAILNSPPPLLATALVFVKINYSFIHLLVTLNGQRVPLSANLWKLPIKKCFAISFHGNRISLQYIFSLHKICWKYQLY